MEDLTDEKAPAPKKKKKGKLLLFIGAPLLLGGGGAAAYGTQAGWFDAGAKDHDDAKSDKPKLVLKGDEKRAAAGGEGGEHGGGDSEAASGEHGGQPTPKGEGGDKYASSYYPLEKEFTSNLQDSVHFIQVGIAVSTPYDEKVLDNIKTHEIAIRSAVLMALGETTEDQVFTAEGKKAMQTRLAAAINGVLKEKEGFGGVGNVYFTNFIVQ